MLSNELNLRIVDMAKSNIEHNDRMFEFVQRLESESLTRLVWLVAISGFSMLNLPVVAKTMGIVLPNLSLVLWPWVATAVCGVLGHWQFRNMKAATFALYMERRELLMAFVANGPQSATMAGLFDILRARVEPLTKTAKQQLWATRWAEWLEALTVALFVVSVYMSARGFLSL